MTESLFLDTDCLSTFLVVGYENIILQLYAGRIAIPQQVYEELKKVHYMKLKVDALINSKRIMLYHIEVSTDAATLYLQLTSSPDKGYRIIGSGEAAAIVLTKQFDGILGSNNLRDILPYIQKYNLKHRTSADIMVEAYEQNIIKEGQGNTIWRDMQQRNRKMPAATFSEYLAKRKE